MPPACAKTLREAGAADSFRLMRSLILSLIVGVSAPAWSQDAEPAPAATDVTARDTEVTFGGPEPVVVESEDARHVFTAELATTPEQMARGLMWRESLAPDAGMLFHYTPAQRSAMWMENTLIDLDLLFIEPDGRIFKIVAHAQGGSRRALAANTEIAGVLEIPAGRAFELGIRPGDTVRHAFFGNAAEAVGNDEAEPAGESAAAETPEDAQ